MLAKFQSESAIATQIAEGYRYYLICRDESLSRVGYIAVRAQSDRRLFISKFYLHAGERGSGRGRACLLTLERESEKSGLKELYLTVNKYNPSVSAYKSLGFQIVDSVVADIGAGYVMDDYVMKKPLVQSPCDCGREWADE